MSADGTVTAGWTARAAAAPWFDVGACRVRLLRDDEALSEMLRAVREARTSVDLEMYWIGDDAVGVAFRDALAARARAGVRVRVVYDAIGSLSLGRKFWAPLEAARGRVVEYHSLSPFHPSFDLDRIEERDHRKLLVVDERRGFTGGVNLATQWLAPDEGGEGWRDDVVEVEGPVVAELGVLFADTWRRVARERPRAGERRRLAPPGGPVWVVAGKSRGRRRGVRREYLARIHRATRSIDVANSYFLPDRAVRAALYRAALRGVRVRVLVPARGDVAVVQYAIEASYEELLARGVQIFTLPGPVMHAKSAVFDDTFATVGSYNFDERSRKNLELNLAVEDAPFARHVRGWFERDLARAHRVDLYRWRARPVLRRGVEAVAWALRRLL